MKVFPKVLLVLFSGVTAVFLVCAIYYFSVTAGVKLNPSKLDLAQNNINLYDMNGDPVAQCSAAGENGVDVTALRPYTINAFVSAEDKNFYSHHGFDYKRMGMALWRNFTSFSFKEGASTISQQLIKNTQLTPEKTIKRKLRELKLTRRLEKDYEKDQIMEMYLNTIYFGHSCFGLEEAARFYFDCAPSELSLAQSAMLAGIIKSPNNYSPFKNPQSCLSRRNYVLNAMQKNGYIDKSARLEAEAEELPTEANSHADAMKFYYRAVFDELEEKLGEEIYGGLNIYTFLDVTLQKKLEEEGAQTDTDKSFCVIDNQKHGVKAFYSTVGAAKRLPGSLIKPLLVYAPALQENTISPATPILDEKVDYGGYSPKNYDGTYHGYVSAREALSNSYNVPAVKILNGTGIAKSAAYLKKVGLDVDSADYSLALALGGMKQGYSLPRLCAAYTVFSSDGKYAPCSFISKITDGEHKTLYEKEVASQKVFDEESVTLLNDMLRTATKSGTAKKLKNLPYEICAKTGTCGNSSGNTDAYCISYTSSDTVGVWLGNADNSVMENITGGGLPANLNLHILEYLYEKSSPAPLAKSKNVIRCSLDKQEYAKNHVLLLTDDNAPVQEKTFSELFKKSNAPRQKSTYFSNPKINTPSIFVNDTGVCIVLCHAEYYTILINRQGDDGFHTVYQGEMQEKILDVDVEEGKKYIYSVTPYYGKFVGKTVILPEVIYTETQGETPFSV